MVSRSIDTPAEDPTPPDPEYSADQAASLPRDAADQFSKGL